MIETTTSSHDAELQECTGTTVVFSDNCEPSGRVLENILAYSRNLEVRGSAILEHVHYLKS